MAIAETVKKIVRIDVEPLQQAVISHEQYLDQLDAEVFFLKHSSAEGSKEVNEKIVELEGLENVPVRQGRNVVLFDNLHIPLPSKQIDYRETITNVLPKTSSTERV